MGNGHALGSQEGQKLSVCYPGPNNAHPIPPLYPWYLFPTGQVDRHMLLTAADAAPVVATGRRNGDKSYLVLIGYPD